MILKTIPFTKAKYDELQEQYNKLQKELVAVMARLKEAREMGDLSENGAYKYAKFELGDIRRQSSKIKHLLVHGYVETNLNQSGIIGFGNVVTVKSNKGLYQFTLVSQYESDPLANKLSEESPLGKAVFGKTAGDTVSVTSPSGVLEYVIQAVE